MRSRRMFLSASVDGFLKTRAGERPAARNSASASLAVVFELAARDDVAVHLADDLFDDGDLGGGRQADGRDACKDQLVAHRSIITSRSGFAAASHGSGGCDRTPALRSDFSRNSTNAAGRCQPPESSGSRSTPAGVNCAPSRDDTSAIKRAGSIFEPGMKFDLQRAAAAVDRFDPSLLGLRSSAARSRTSVSTASGGGP